MERIAEEIIGQMGGKRLIVRKPIERDHSKLALNTSGNESPSPTVDIQSSSRPMTDRPSNIKSTRQRRHLIPLLTALTKLLHKKFKLIK